MNQNECFKAGFTQITSQPVTIINGSKMTENVGIL